MEEVRESALKSLLDSTEDYIKTSYELFKLKTIDKATDKAAVIISRTITVLLFYLFLLMASIGAGFWLGSVLGNTWYGFFAIAGFYGLMVLILYFFTHSWFKKVIGNMIIKQTFK